MEKKDSYDFSSHKKKWILLRKMMTNKLKKFIFLKKLFIIETKQHKYQLNFFLFSIYLVNIYENNK